MTRFLASIIAALLAAQVSQTAFAHGGVVEEEDLCVIKVNYLRGHFKIYQPLIDGHEEYCEDLPNATESVFVMEYLHDSLANAAVDFRIIRDVTGKAALPAGRMLPTSMTLNLQPSSIRSPP